MPRSLLVAPLAAALLLPLATPGSAQEAPSPSPTTTTDPGASPSPTATPVPVLGTTLTLAASAPTVVHGTVLQLTGRLTRSDGTAVAGAPVDVYLRQGGTTNVVRIARVTTSSDGTAVHRFVPRVSAEHSLRFPGDATAAPSQSNKAITRVRPRISGAFSPAGLLLGQTATLTGRLVPAYSGARITVQRRQADGSWRGVATVGIDGEGDYRWSVKPGLVGRYVFRALLPGTMAYDTAATPARELVVDYRTLRQGDRGGDVETLERRLLAQKGDVGRVDGVFDYDLRHAVTAFQKSQGLARTGVYDRATRNRLASPLPIKVRHPAAGRAVEVDLRKQVLYLSEGGRLVRVVDVSTGNNEYYESEGVTYKAFTPQGRFRIERKIDGVRVSRLGELYRPAYFYRGWAIHGSKNVPPYPDSHGCVRVTNPSMDRLFGLLTIGTPVTVYTS